MIRFNQELVLPLGDENITINVLPESGVSVAVSYWTGAEYVDDPSSPVTNPVAIQSSSTVVRLVPSGGYAAVTGKGVQRATDL